MSFAASSSSAIPDNAVAVANAAKIEEHERLLDAMKSYETAIPDDALTFILEKAGCNLNDVKAKRLIALATQKFMYQVACGAKEICKIRKDPSGRDRKRKQLVLTMEDLTSSLEEHGIDVIKPEFFADQAGTPADSL